MIRKSEKGFTLVELMIVVVIIGILAAIAIPKFGSMIGKAKTTEAKSQLGTIISLETTYWNTSNAYVNFASGANCPSIGYIAPTGASVRFAYSFVDSLAIATELPGQDVNGDGDVTDTLALSVTQNKTNSTDGNLTW